MITASALKTAGDRNSFQIYSIFFVCFKWMIVSLVVFLPSYLLMTPTFTCGDRLNVSEIDACPIIKLCKFDHPFTITAYTGLYCDDKYIRNAIISSEFVGSIIGLILLSYLADVLGRKFIIVSTLFLTAIGTMIFSIGTYYKIIPLLFVGIVLMGFGSYSLSMVSYSYLSQINNDLWRQKSLIMTYSFWAIGQIMLYPIITLLEGWEYICFYTLIVPLIILLFMSTLIVETPEFLIVKLKYKECLQSLNAIAKFNGNPTFQRLPQMELPEKEAEGMRQTFSKKQFYLPLIILSFAQVCNNGYYYTVQYSLNDYGYRFEVNMLVIGILQLISCLFTNHYCHKMHRKKWIMIFMILSGSMGLLIQFTDTSSVVELIFMGASRLFNTVAFALFSLICSESFPTAVKSTGMGITEAMSNVGNMIAPFLVIFAQTLGVKAILIGGIINIAGGFTMSIVKETMKESAAHNENPLLKDDVTSSSSEENSQPKQPNS